MTPVSGITICGRWLIFPATIFFYSPNMFTFALQIEKQ
jgi:hypothetical protein